MRLDLEQDENATPDVKVARRKAAEAAELAKRGGSWMERLRGIVRLAEMGTPHAEPHAAVVAAGLGDAHPKVRASAARALRLLGGVIAMTYAKELRSAAIKDTHRDVREEAQETLRACAVQKPAAAAEGEALGKMTKQKTLHCPTQPHCWGISLQQLLEFRDELFDTNYAGNLPDYCLVHKFAFIDGACVHLCTKKDCPYGDHAGVPYIPLDEAPVESSQVQAMHPNMHLVVAREIKPRTKPCDCSFALMKNPDGLRITTFVTHTWEEPFDHFTGTLEMALNPSEVVWICSIALDQNADIKKALDSDDLLQSPFAKALRFASKLVVAMDGQLLVPERSWCVFELEKASQWSIPTFVWPDQLMSLTDLEDKVDHLDVRKAKASVAKDQERIHKSIKDGSGYDALNRRLRAFLGDRVRFYEASIRKHVDQFESLTKDMEVAHREKDTAWLKALEAQSLGESRLVQLEMERDARKKEQSLKDQIHHEQKRMKEQCEAHMEHNKRLDRDLKQVCGEKSKVEGDLHDTRRQMHEMTRRLELLRRERGTEKVEAEEEVLKLKAKLDYVMSDREKQFERLEEAQKQIRDLSHALSKVQKERDAAQKKGRATELQVQELRAKMKFSPASPRPGTDQVDGGAFASPYPATHTCQ